MQLYLLFLCKLKVGKLGAIIFEVVIAEEHPFIAYFWSRNL